MEKTHLSIDVAQSVMSVFIIQRVLEVFG